MELTNEFVIDRTVEETWRILNDLEFIAPCMPGAQLQEIEGDEYRGVVKIKVGPITAQYKGKASFVEQDEVNRVARLKAEGRDPRQGNANAMVTAKMQEAGEGKTTVNIHTDLGLSGKIASFGRGAIEDVSKKILGQFADNLRDKLEAGEDAPGEAEAGVEEAPSSSESVSSSEEASTSSTNGEAPASSAGASNVRKIDAPEPTPVDLLAVSGPSTLKRALPAGIGMAIVIWILYRILGRG
ncbi:MAG: SRPBCC family protein [Actinomycetia bacterium]|nr:SRPBCC family protein [Actinomycetes bacterium]MCP4226981.1 SRPBCC family protein [Actinomycetes bacterium]MCP5035350.1 SRPBCC family protein [Actinomycetes bacterium]